jgi:2'-5' RNA ligase
MFFFCSFSEAAKFGFQGDRIMTFQEKFAGKDQPLCHRFFLAIPPPAAEAARIGALRDGLGGAVGRVSDDRLHITMLIFDDLPFVPPLLAEVVKQAMASLNTPPLHLSFDRIVTSGRNTCLVSGEGLPALTALKKHLVAALNGVGLPPRKKWVFNPHISLLYDAHEPRTEAIMPISWKAEEIVLIHSLVGLTKHVELDRWPLIEQPRLL